MSIKNDVGMKSPMLSLREAVGVTIETMSGEGYLSPQRYRLLEEGAFDRVPPFFCKLAEVHIGEGAGAKLAKDYQDFKAGLSEERRAGLEKQLFPAGKWSGMIP